MREILSQKAPSKNYMIYLRHLKIIGIPFRKVPPDRSKKCLRSTAISSTKQGESQQLRPYLHQTISASKISALYITVNLKKAFCVLNFTTNLLPVMQLNCCKNTAILYMNVKKTGFPSFFLHNILIIKFR